MKKITYATLLASSLILVANCSAVRKQIATPSAATREGVFQEITTSDEPPPGFADLCIRASLKTHLPGKGTLLEFKNSPHGGEYYRFVLTIDGQEVIWKVPGQRENVTVARDPHEGLGMKYVLQKKIRLRAGRSKISLSVPGEKHTQAVAVNLQGGNSYTLEFRPIYPGYGRHIRSFNDGFLGFSTLLRDASTN